MLLSKTVSSSVRSVLKLYENMLLLNLLKSKSVGVGYRGSDGTGCFRIRVRYDTMEFTNMRIAGLRR